MRSAILSCFLFAACGSTAALVPSHPAVARYTASLDDARAAVHDVLTDRWLHVDTVGADGFATPPECRTDDGEQCAKHSLFDKSASADAATYGFQLAARVVPTSAGVLVEIIATLEPRAGTQAPAYAIGKGDVPSWLQHEVEDVQAAVRHKLAPVRPTT